VANWALISDFDGTASMTDVGDAMAKHFVGPNCWTDVDAFISGRRLTAKDAYEQVLGRMQVSDQDLADFVLQFELDPYFGVAASLFADRGLPVLILSDGYHYYIDRILKKEGLDWIPRIANQLVIENTTAIPLFPHHGLLNCHRCGCCKTYHLRQLKTSGYKIIYFGDGYTDRCAARSADVVFAKDYLAQFLSRQEIPFIPFKNYQDALPKLKRYLNNS